MAKREEFIDAINLFRSASQSISVEQRIGLLQQAVQEYGLSIEEAEGIIKETGLNVGGAINYFRVLGLSNHEFENLNETTITSIIDDAHKQHYTESLRAGGLPRPDGRTQEQWRNILNHARDTLIDPHKREEYLSQLLSEEDSSDSLINDVSNNNTTDTEIYNQNHNQTVSIDNKAQLNTCTFDCKK